MMQEPITSQGFSADDRLRKPAEFERVYARRASASDGLLLVFVEATGWPASAWDCPSPANTAVRSCEIVGSG